MALTTVPASLSATALTLTTAAQPNITSVGTLTGLTVDDITINGSTISDAADLLLDVGGDISFDADGGDIRLLDGGTQFGKFTRDGGDFLISSSENDKDIKFAGADGGANITALTLDMSNAGAATFNSTVTANAGVIVDNITIDGQEIDVSSGNFTLDVAGNIVLDSDTGVLQVQDGGTVFYQLAKSSNEIRITSHIADDDLVFRGNDSDGGGYFTALTLDMSEAGAATFNSTVATGGNLTVNGNTNLTGNLTVDSTTLYVSSSSNTVGIGTTSPSFTAVSGSTSQKGLHIQNSGNDTSAHLKLTGHNNTGTPGQATDFEIIHRGDALRTIFRHGGGDALTIGSARDVGIGKVPGAVRLDVETALSGNLAGLFTNTHASGSYGLKVQAGSSSSNYGFVVTDKDNSNPTHFYVRGDGQVGINTNSPAGTLHTVARSGTTGLVVTGVASNNIATFARSTGQTLGIKELGSTSLELESSTSLGYDVGSSYNHEFMVGGAQVFKIYSDGKVDIKNSGTDKIVRFINTGSGTQGVTIGTTTSNSAGTGLHVGHNGTKAFLHPYNYTAGGYQQMEIACSDFVLKVNGSASGMSMDSSANAVFYGDVTINDANDRLKQNGVAREAKGGYIQGNQTVSYTINHTAQSTFHVRCGFNHYGLLSYGCVLDQIFANGPGGITSATATISSSTGPGGGWSVARVDSQNVTVSKSAGNYAGGGYYYIIVEGANL